MTVLDRVIRRCRHQTPGRGESGCHLRRGGVVVDRVGERQLLDVRRRLFAAVEQADLAVDRYDPVGVDRWEREASRARIELCELVGDDDLTASWSRWHRRRWPLHNDGGGR